MGQQLALAQIQNAVFQVQQAAAAVELLRQHGDAGQVLRFLEKGFLAAGGAAFLHMAAHCGGGVAVPDAKAGSFHLIQHLICQPLDAGKVVPLPADAVPHQPALVCGIVAHPVGVLIAKAPGVAGIVQRVGLCAGSRGGVRRGVVLDVERLQCLVLVCKGGAVRLRGGAVDFLTILHRPFQGGASVGFGTPALIPLGTHQPGGTEHPVHALEVCPKPECQQVCKTQVGLAVAVVVGLPVTGIQGGKPLAVLRGAGGLD